MIQSKALIENLMLDNKMLHEDIEDFKKVINKIMIKCREVKRDLDLERIKNAKISVTRQ